MGESIVKVRVKVAARRKQELPQAALADAGIVRTLRDVMQGPSTRALAAQRRASTTLAPTRFATARAGGAFVTIGPAVGGEVRTFDFNFRVLFQVRFCCKR